MGEFFVGIEFGCERLEISVESFTVYLKLAYSEGGGLKGVSEGALLQCEMHSAVRGQRTVCLDLSFDGTSQGMR